ncbi:MAG: BamA/TamA family outer membrane protein, partial [bacterium]|nr:BamA/TamA family outer membrane protein [bacterium]
NGPQFVLGGMRSGNGTSVGAGYRRVDLWNERISFRATARGTIKKSYMFDLDVEFPRLTTDRAEVRLYSKHENSPMMDYYGQGPESNRANRSSYRLEDTGVDLSGRYRLWRDFYVGGAGGIYGANTGPGRRSGFPSTDERFEPDEVPGLNEQTSFLRAGAQLQYDWRDNPKGPTRGGNYYARHLRYWDRDLGKHTFHRLESVIEQYLPYWNRKRVIALRLATVMTWAREDQTVPFYMQATLGGNKFLRGFGRFRFHGANSILFTAEHRWHVFSG